MLGTLALVAACGHPGSEASEEDRLTGLQQALLDEPSHELELIGETDPRTPLDVVQDVALDRKGRVYVADASGDYLHVFDRSGRGLDPLGRGGDGPGEFRSLRSVDIFPGDTLMAYDLALRRITLFTPRHRDVVYTVSLDGSGAAGAPTELRAHPDGSFVGIHLPALAGPDPEGGLPARALRWDRAGTVTDTIAEFQEPRTHRWQQDNRRGGAVDVFGSRPIVDVGPDGRLYRVSTDTMGLVMYAEDQEQSWSLDLEPSRADGELVNAVLEETMGPPEIRDRQRESAESVPVVTGFVADDEGRLWFGVRGKNVADNRWVAVTPEGEPLISVTVPSEHAVKAVRGDLLVTGQRFPVNYFPIHFEVPHLKIFELQPANDP